MKRKEAFEVHGELIGFRIEPRTKKIHGTDSPLIHVLVEDDGHWCGGGTVFDAYWINDLIYTAEALRERLRTAPKKRKGDTPKPKRKSRLVAFHVGQRVRRREMQSCLGVVASVQPFMVKSNGFLLPGTKAAWWEPVPTEKRGRK